MSKNNKVVKYKVINTNIDKKFIGKNLDLERVKAKGGSGSDGGRKPGSTNKITLAKLAEQMADLTKTVKDGFAEQAKFNKSIREDLNRVIKLNNLRK
jgi:hypothetical protein